MRGWGMEMEPRLRGQFPRRFPREKNRGCGVQDGGLRDARCGMQEEGCGMKDAGCGMKDEGCECASGARRDLTAGYLCL